jgi:hypothetical protein
MQRVRVGLTGLAFVFLAVMLAAIFLRRPADEPPITPNMIEQQKAGNAPAAAASAPAGQPSEPLAELGVAPGSADSNAAAAPQAPATPPPAAR